MDAFEQEIAELRTQLYAVGIMSAAHQKALLALLEWIAQHSGIDSVDGVSIREAYEKERAAQLEKALLDLGDTKPNESEILRREIEKTRKQ